MKNISTPSDNVLANLILNQVSDGIILTDPTGHVVWINEAFTRMSGFELADLFGRRPGDILQGELTTKESKRILSHAIAARESCCVDIVNYSRSGYAYTSEINLSPILDDNGELIFFVAIQRDVTQHRDLSEQSEDFNAYRRALDNQAIVSVTDARGRIRFVNTKFCEISGYSRSELIGRTHKVVNSGEHERSFFREMWRQISGCKPWHGEVCNRAKSGELYWVDTTIVPVLASDGSVERYVSIRYDITERKLAEVELRRLSEVDVLTNLANRSRFSSELRQYFGDAASEDVPFAGLVIMMDIDHFKDLNDTKGHHAGDLLLKETARRLIECTDKDVTVARLGGDEFALIIPRVHPGAETERILGSLHQFVSVPAVVGDVEYTPSYSMGVTHFPRDGQTVEGLLINADIALYEAKRGGRNQWCIFDPTVREKLAHRDWLKGVLIRAVQNNDFDIVMQPISCIRQDKHNGFEVLVRLSENGQNISPDHFVPLAEELGLISDIGRIVMRKAGSAVRNMLDLGLRPGRVAINAAPCQLKSPDFVEDVQDMMFENALSPEHLAIEITETALIGRSTEIVADTLRRLRNIGIAISLDDFGTGFSSLSHLKDFCVDKIKIDKSFIRDIEQDEGDLRLVRGLIGLAHLLGLKVVAEGVETEAQLNTLNRYDCDEFQGYYRARPMPIDQAFEYLRGLSKIEKEISTDRITIVA